MSINDLIRKIGGGRKPPKNTKLVYSTSTSNKTEFKGDGVEEPPAKKPDLKEMERAKEYTEAGKKQSDYSEYASASGRVYKKPL